MVVSLLSLIIIVVLYLASGNCYSIINPHRTKESPPSLIERLTKKVFGLWVRSNVEDPHLDMSVVASRAHRRDCDSGGQAEGAGREMYLRLAKLFA